MKIELNLNPAWNKACYHLLPKSIIKHTNVFNSVRLADFELNINAVVAESHSQTLHVFHMSSRNIHVKQREKSKVCNICFSAAEWGKKKKKRSGRKMKDLTEARIKFSVKCRRWANVWMHSFSPLPSLWFIYLCINSFCFHPITEFLSVFPCCLLLLLHLRQENNYHTDIGDN